MQHRTGVVVLIKGTKKLPEYQVKDALRAMQALERGYEKKQIQKKWAEYIAFVDYEFLYN